MMKVCRGLDVKISELTGSQSLVLEGLEADSHLVLVLVRWISGFRS
jgi:hypothetical protein